MHVMVHGGRFEIRPATADDGPFLVGMLLEAVNWQPGRPEVPRERVLTDPSLAHYVVGWPGPHDGGVVAVAAGEPIGAAWWRYLPGSDPGYGFVAPDVPELSLAVVPVWRGRGVGRALLRSVKHAAAATCARISLSVERANPAQRLYLAEGFLVVASGRDADTMTCDLRGEPSPHRQPG